MRCWEEKEEEEEEEEEEEVDSRFPNVGKCVDDEDVRNGLESEPPGILRVDDGLEEKREEEECEEEGEEEEEGREKEFAREGVEEEGTDGVDEWERDECEDDCCVFTTEVIFLPVPTAPPPLNIP